VSGDPSGASGRFFDLSPERLALLRERRPAALPAAGDDLAPRRDGAPPPLSFAQERLWFLDRLEPGTPALDIAAGLALGGRLDRGALAAALGETVRRHEVLRWRFPATGGRPEVRVAPPVPVPLPLVDLAALPEGRRRPAAERLARAHGRFRFDLAAGPLLRALLVGLGGEEHRLHLTVHHVVADGWSLGILFGEVAAVYAALAAGQPPHLPALPVQYGDWAAWQRRWLSGERLEAEVEWWRRRLAGAPPALDLPADRPRPAVQGSRGVSVAATLPAPLADRVRAAGRAAPGGEASPFMVLLAALQLLLARWSGGDDIVVGAPVAGRTRRAAEGLVGLFLNHLVLRTDLSGDPTFGELIARARQTALGAYAHQEVPFEKLLAELEPERDLSRTPLFQVYLNLLSFPRPRVAVPGLTFEPLAASRPPAKFDFTVYAHDAGPGGAIDLDLVANADLFGRRRAEEALAQLVALLEQGAADPGRRVGELSLLTPAAAAALPDPRRRLDDAWPGPVHEALARHAAERPGAPAVVGGEGAVSYGELAAAVEGLAGRLAVAGVGRGEVVALHAGREPALVAALLAVQRAGAAFTVLDPAHPPARNALSCHRAGVRLLLALAAAGPPPPEVAAAVEAVIELPPLAAGDASWPAGDGAPPAPPVALDGDDLAYVAFTSGSTGVPKAVAGLHRSLTHFMEWQRGAFGLGADDRFSLLSGLAHDPLHRDVFTPLWLGAAVVVPDAATAERPERTAAWAAAQRLTVMHLTPSLARTLAAAAGEGGLPALRRVFLLGETVTRADGERLRVAAPAARVVALYGATETQRAVAWQPLADTGAEGPAVVPLGHGMPDVQLLVLAGGALGRGRRAGIGEVGEVCVRSPHFAAGYLGEPAATAERFVPDPFGGARGGRLYRTGDLGRPRLDGGVEALGRADRQVKVRGVRVEPGEVEAALCAHPAVREAAVVPFRERGELRLAAYLVPASRPASLRAVTDQGPAAGDPATRAPGAAVGGEWVAVERLPPEAAPSAGKLRAFLAERLPAAMVPSHLIAVAALPRTPNGKLDRGALPPPAPAEGAAAADAPPAGETEELLAALWREVLGVAAVGREDDFFALGGHSLAITRLLARVEESLGVTLPVREVFRSPRLLDLAAAVEAARGGAGGELAGEAATPDPPLVPVPRDGPLPLSFAQQRLWFLDRFAGGRSPYRVAAALRLSGRLDRGALAAALTAVAARHEALRTTFGERDGHPVQRVGPPAPVPLPLADLAALPPPAGRREEARLLAAAAGRPFDLARGPLLGALLVRSSAEEHGQDHVREHVQEHVLALALHHLVADGASLGVLARDLAAFYAAFHAAAAGELASPDGAASEAASSDPAAPAAAAGFGAAGAGAAATALAALPPLSVQYADFAVWQRRRLTADTLERQLDHWRRRLGDAPPALELPLDRPRPPRQDFRGGRVERRLPAGRAAAVANLGRRLGATPFMLLVTALAAVLGRWTGAEDLVVGAPVAGRRRRELEGLVGLFLDLVALRLDLSGELTFAAAAGRAREAALDAFAHQDVPFERVLQELAPQRDPSRHPLFDVLVNVLEPPPPIELPGLALSLPDAVEREAKLALTLYAAAAPQSMHLALVYQRALFDAPRMEELLDQVVSLLEGAAADPHRPLAAYDLLTPAAARRLPDPAAPLPAVEQTPVVERFAARARAAPERPALRQGDREWSYGALAGAAFALGSRLAASGVAPGAVVAVSGPPGFGLVAACLAVWAARAVLLTVDPDLPPARRRRMLEAARATLLLAPAGEDPDVAYRQVLVEVDEATAAPAGAVPPATSRLSAPPPAPAAHPPDAAYVFFTSGTTGEPKAVLGSHRGLAHFLEWQRETFAVGPDDRVAQLTPLSFDVVLRDLFLPLVAGAVLVLPERAPLPVERVAQWLDGAGVTLLHAVPTLARAALAAAPAGVELAALRHVFFAGEPLTAGLVTSWRRRFPVSPAARPGGIVNLYGPTETTLARCWYPVPEPPHPGVQPVGRPLPGSQAWVLAAGGRRAAVGELGEVVLRTPYRSLGYLAAPPADRARFAVNPCTGDPDDLVYRTGDRGRLRPDGLLEVLGRLDDQVKVRGVRVEPGEVAAALADHPEVAAAAVVPRPVADGVELAAFVVAAPGSRPDLRRLRAHLARRLPAPLVPAQWAFLDRLPTRPNGKLDVAALPPASPAPPAAPPVPPRDDLERELAGLFGEVLGVAPPGVEEGFFDLGGHSLQAVSLLAAVETRYSRRLPLAALFEHPTVAELACQLREAPARRRPSPLVAVQAAGDRPPLVLVHPGGGGVLCYSDLARALGQDQPLWALEAVGLDGGEEPLVSIDAMAERYLAALRRRFPGGPYHLGGWSFGGRVAFEMARRLRTEGEEVALLALLDIAPDPSPGPHGRADDDPALVARAVGADLGLSAADLAGLDDAGQLARIVERAAAAGRLPADFPPSRAAGMFRVFKANLQAARSSASAPTRAGWPSSAPPATVSTRPAPAGGWGGAGGGGRSHRGPGRSPHDGAASPRRGAGGGAAPGARRHQRRRRRDGRRRGRQPRIDVIGRTSAWGGRATRGAVGGVRTSGRRCTARAGVIRRRAVGAPCPGTARRRPAHERPRRR
jgi:amino acid adenylation domain-containing protein